MNITTFLLTLGFVYIHCIKYVVIKEFRSHVHDPTSVHIDFKVVNQTFLNYNLTVLKIHNVRVLCSMRVRKLTSGSKTLTMLNWKHIDFCKFLGNFEQDKILRAIFSKLLQTTFLISCPLKEGFYYMKDAYIDGGLLGILLKRGAYSIQIEVSLVDDGISRLISTHMKAVV